jgi:hypothetical protein
VALHSGTSLRGGGAIVARQWLDSWAGLGALVDGMVRQGFDVALTRNGDAGWRALFYPSSFIHESRAGSAWGTTPWKAVQDAAWMTLERRRAR